MLEKSFGLFFFLKQPKKETVVERYVYLRITVNGISKELSTKRLWEPSRWSQDTGRAIGSKDDARSLNSYLDVLSSQVLQAKQSLLEANKTITAEAIKNLLTGKGEPKRMLLEIFKEHNAQMKALVGSEFAPATLTRYTTAHDHTASFINWKYGKGDLDISN
jgi:hypothetical protein